MLIKNQKLEHLQKLREAAKSNNTQELVKTLKHLVNNIKYDKYSEEDINIYVKIMKLID